MTQITHSISIDAPLQTVFDLARDAEFHTETARASGEIIVAGRKSGRFELGDSVTFEGKHLGVRQRLSAKIIAMDAPHSFTDEMTRGVFRALRHEHRFTRLENGQTRMTNIIVWRSPLGILGVIADQIAVKRHLFKFLASRGLQIKTRAELLAKTPKH